MPGFAAVSFKGQNLDGPQRVLEPVSLVNTYKLQMDSADQFVKASVNGGAWFIVWGAFGPVVTLQQAYDGGGAVGTGLGRTVATMDGGAAVFTNSGANANDVLQINKTPAGGQLGRGLYVNMNANATFGPGIGMDIAAPASVGIGITMAVACASQAVNVTNNGTGSSFFTLKTNPGIGAGAAGITYLDQAPGCSGARNQPGIYVEFTPGYTVNGSFAADPIRVLHAPLSAAGGVTVTLNRSIFSISHAPTSLGGGLVTDTTTGFSITMTPLTASAVVGQQIIVGNGGAGNPSARALVVSWNQDRGTWVDLGLRAPGVAQLAEQLAINIDLQTNADANTFRQRGVAILMGGSLGGTSNAATSSALDVDFRGIGGTTNGIIRVVNTSTTAALTAAETGFVLDLSTAQHNNQVINGIILTLPATTAAAANGQGGIVITSSATRERIFDVAFDNRTGGTIAAYRFSAANVIAGAVTGIDMNLSTVTNTSAVALTPFSATVTANMASNASVGYLFTRSGTHSQNGTTFSGSGVSISNAPTAGGAGVNVTEGASLVNISHTTVAGAGGSITDSTTMLNISMNPAAGFIGTNTSQGIFVSMQAGCGATSKGMFVQSFAPAHTTGILNITAQGTLTNTIILGLFDATGIANNTNPQAIGVQVKMSAARAGMNSATLMDIGVNVDRRNATTAITYAGKLVDLQNVPTGPGPAQTLTEAGTILNINHAPVAGAGAITDTTTGLKIAMTPIASGTPVTKAITITVGANATANSHAINVTMNGASDLVSLTMTNGTAARSLIYAEVTATTISGGGHYILYTAHNATYASSQTYSNANMQFNFQPVSSGGGTTLTLSGRIIDINYAPTTAVGGAITDSMIGINLTMSPAASGTPNTRGIVITMGANATATTAAPITATVNAANRGPTPVLVLNGKALFSDTGVPNNANGANGDTFFREDGGAGTSIYKKIAGAWAAIA